VSPATIIISEFRFAKSVESTLIYPKKMSRKNSLDSKKLVKVCINKKTSLPHRHKGKTILINFNLRKQRDSNS